ncbi:MAG: ATP-dependent Clp protease proteolytic subunit [Bacteroidota bacterium]|nr:ATP-dependent Clp protease proteolytic subunit [Bacteroidota bacterium]
MSTPKEKEQQTEVESNLVSEEKNENKLNLDNFSDLVNLILSDKDVTKFKDQFKDHIKFIFDRHSVSKKYQILFLYDENNSINEKMTDKIYAAIPENNIKPILLIIHSKGGEVEPAYLISKTCKEKAPNFVVAIPRRAKSAATLISLGASEIHMGSMSELGPIDPQFGNLPALGLRSSLETIAKVVSDYPKSSEMFAKYLNEQLNLRILGYFERVSESSKQYAQRLLEGKVTPKDIQEIAYAFVYEYKDHSFVIDKEEAAKYLGDIIKVNTEEYQLSNDIHKFVSNVNWIINIVRKKTIEIIGSVTDLSITDLPEKDK